jgi:predicted RNA-binding protein YlxR (DUF448 family)
VRLVRGPDGLVTVDHTATAPGRGAYVCPAPACIELALQRGRFAHAFRARSQPAPTLARDVRAGGAQGTAAPPIGADQ